MFLNNKPNLKAICESGKLGKIAPLILLLCFCFSNLQLIAQYEDPVTTPGKIITFSVTGGGNTLTPAMVTAQKGTNRNPYYALFDANVEIIGANAFDGDTLITGVAFNNDSIKIIGANAFRNCKYLTEVLFGGPEPDTNYSPRTAP